MNNILKLIKDNKEQFKHVDLYSYTDHVCFYNKRIIDIVKQNLIDPEENYYAHYEIINIPDNKIIDCILFPSDLCYSYKKFFNKKIEYITTKRTRYFVIDYRIFSNKDEFEDQMFMDKLKYE